MPDGHCLNLILIVSMSIFMGFSGFKPPNESINVILKPKNT